MTELSEGPIDRHLASSCVYVLGQMPKNVQGKQELLVRVDELSCWLVS